MTGSDGFQMGFSLGVVICNSIWMILRAVFG